MYWQYCSIMMSMTLILTSVLPFEPTGPERALLWATWTYSHVSDSLCSYSFPQRRDGGFCTAPLLYCWDKQKTSWVLHLFDWWHTTLSDQKGSGGREGVVYVDLKTQGRKETFGSMEISIGEIASCSKWGEAHILGNLAPVGDHAPGKKMQIRDLITQLGDSLYHKTKSWHDFWDQLSQAPPVITCLQQQLTMTFCLFFNGTLTWDSWIFNILHVQL